MTDTTYVLPPADALVSEGLVSFSWVVNDRVALDTPLARQKYFDRGYRLFQKKLADFAEASRVPTHHEERELLFMLEALIEAKYRIDVT